VTSSDSGSLVVDFITANGHPDPPLLQRILWSWVEGSTAIALLYSGKNSPSSSASLSALQAASIIAGLPYTFILFYCAQALVILCKEETKEVEVNRKAFESFIFNVRNWQKHLINTVAPGVALGKIVTAVGGWPFSGFSDAATRAIWTVVFSGLYYTSIILLFCGFADYNWVIVSLCVYLGFGLLNGLAHNSIRLLYDIKHGDILTDILCGIFVPMFTISQSEHQMANDKVPQKNRVEEDC